MAHPYPADYDDDVFSEDDVWTPRDSPQQLAIRSGYTGPKNNMGEPDTTGTNESGTMIYLPNEHYVSYSGQWKNGEFDGQGTVLFADDDTYTGGFKDGELHGHGVYKHSNGMVREGEFIDDSQVRGTLIRPDHTFQGTFLAGMPHAGTFTYNDGSVFTGIKETGMKRFGTLKFLDGDVFFGTFEDQNGLWKLNGYGEMIVNSVPDNKFVYKGQMRNGVKHGKGIMHINGITYSAEYNNDREIEGSARIIPKKNGGARHERTRCRRKRLRSSKRR
jgi:hypothetical protein